MVCAMSLQQEQFISEPDPITTQGHYMLMLPSKKPINLTTEFLSASDIPAFIALQEKIRPTLQQPYHLKKRDLCDLNTHLSERMPIFGTKTEDGTLVGFGLLTFLKNEEGLKNLDGYPVQHWQRATTAVAQTVCVDPDFKGNKISLRILDSIFDAAAQNGMTRIVSAIADDNSASKAAFKSAGYTAFSHGTDQKLGYAKTFYARPIY